MNSNREFLLCIKDIKNNETVLKMKNFMQHCDTSCYDHCYNVALISFFICKKFNLDYKAAARAGFLHDLFLYDWKTDKNHGRFHGYTHPKRALNNALHIYFLFKKEKDIIKKHMWPLTLAFPRYIESYIVTFVDKVCATKEIYLHIKNKYKGEKIC